MDNNSKNFSVAVLLAAYNGEQWINEQVSTILSQKGVSIHLFISVDLSNDNTYSNCVELAGIHNNITVIPYGKKFGGAAKNFFRLIQDINFSNFDYVSFSDQDDIWINNKLNIAIETINKNSMQAYSSNVEAFWMSGRKKLVKKSYKQKKYDYFFESAGPGCTYVFKQQALQQFKFFLKNNWAEINMVSLHDWMIYSYFRENNMPWYIDNNSTMLYRQHSSNQMGFNSSFKTYFKRIQLVNNKWYRLEVKKIIQLITDEKNNKIRLNYWFLVKNFYELRRRPRDAFVLLLFIIFRIF
jgi:rhamnosyltransferase